MTVLEVFEQAKALDTQERKQLVKLLIDTLDSPASTTPAEEKHSILELAGLGADIWKGIDAHKHTSISFVASGIIVHETAGCVAWYPAASMR